MNNTISRRSIVKSSILGLVTVSIPNIVFAKHIYTTDDVPVSGDKIFYRYPSIDDEIVQEVVGKSHFDLERVKEIVNKRPELAKATWDWSFGDWESAIGAASHVGRRDIVEFLLSKGAMPNIFTFAVLGAFDVVKGMVEFYPGVQKIAGPHGISLLAHAEVGLRMKDKMSQKNIDDTNKLIDYLKALGDADSNPIIMIDEAERPMYMGDYKYGEGEKEGLSVKLDMRKNISLGKLGQSGGSLSKIGEHRFSYKGAPSIQVSFQVENNIVKSLTVHEPELTLVAKKI